MARTRRISRISAIWIIPIVTLIIAIWMVYSNVIDKGIEFTLVADDAHGIIAGKTVIKSRNVDVGIIDAVTLSRDYKKVELKGRIYKDMTPLINNNSVFWLVQPQIGREGISGLGTLLSGVYIELSPGNDDKPFLNKPFQLGDSPPISSLSDLGIHIKLESEQNGVIPKGAPVMFRGFRVGHVEIADFNIQTRKMDYQLFITSPYDSLVTKNVRFWKEGGVNLSLSSKGANLEIPSLDVIFSGGVSFDVPEGVKFGKPVTQDQLQTFYLYEDKDSIKDSQYVYYHEFLLFFSDTISGLHVGAPVEYRGIRLGTVSKVPFYSEALQKEEPILSYNIPVLIRIEPARLDEMLEDAIDLVNLIKTEQQNGLRAALKSKNILTNTLYVDLDFYPDSDTEDNSLTENTQRYGYDTIKTISVGLSQLQAKVIQTLDNFNQLPLDKTVGELNQMLADSQKLMVSLTKLVNSKEVQALPHDLQATVQSLNETIKSIQPGSQLHIQLKTDLRKFEETMDELTPLLNTLNDKSNALIFSAPKKDDFTPKAKGN